jgi:hypothetical protein
MVKKYQRKGGHGGKRPGAGRPRKKREPGPCDDFFLAMDESNAEMVASLDQFLQPPLSPPKQRMDRKRTYRMVPYEERTPLGKARMTRSKNKALKAAGLEHMNWDDAVALVKAELAEYLKTLEGR